MLKNMIIAGGFLVAILAAPPSMAGVSSNLDATLTPAKTSLLNLSQAETQKLAQDAADFVGKNFVTDSCLNEDQRINSPPEPLNNAMADRMVITGKWSRVDRGVSVEGGIILGQGMCTAFVVRNARHRVLAVGSVSIGLRGINDNNNNPVVKPYPNIVAIFYKSPADLQTALPQIKGFARFYIKSFDDPSSPETNPPPTFTETQYDLGRCGAGKSGKHIDVKTCPQQTRTLPVE